MRLSMSRYLFPALIMFALSGISRADTLMCKVNEGLTLTDSGMLEATELRLKTHREVFYVDTESGKITGGPMNTEGWGETKVYPVAKYHSLTVVSFTHGQDTNRGLRTLYIGERSKNNEHAFQISDGRFMYAGTCKLS